MGINIRKDDKGETMSFVLPPVLALNLRQQADEEQRSVSSLLRIMIREGLAKRGRDC